MYGLLLMRTAIKNDKKWQIKGNQCWSTTSARKTVGESSALCQSVDKQRWKVATETNMTYMTNKGGRWQQRIYDKQRWKVATETNMTNKTDSNMDWESQFETIWSKKIRFWGKSYVTAVVFGANGHFSEPAYSVKRLSLLLKINPYRLLNWDTKTSFGWVNSSSSTAVRRLSSHHYEDKLSFPDFHFLMMEHLTQRE